MKDKNSQSGEDTGRVSTSRRKTLKAIGTSSTTLGAVGLFASPTGASRNEETVTITTVRLGDEPQVKKEVPADWWEYEERAERVKKQLRRKFREDPTIEGIGLGTSEETISDRRKSAVTVQVNPKTGTDASVPNAVGDVPVSIVPAARPEPDTCYTDTYDPVPGGVRVNNGNTYATATCPVTDWSGEKMMMTCGHLWSDCKEDITGKSLYQETQYIGDVVENSVKQDWAIAPLDDFADVDGFKNTIINTDAQLAGHVTYDGLKDLKSNETTVYKKGYKTCKTDGLVKELDVKVGRCNCPDCDYTSYDYVKTSTTTDSGDSGSPHYHEYYDEYGNLNVAIISVHHGGESVGCGAYQINDTHGIKFSI